MTAFTRWTPRSERDAKRLASLVAAAALALVSCGRALAQTETPATVGAAPSAICDAKRPIPSFNRWSEDWAVLADPCAPREPMDSLKYIPLSGDPLWYLSLGANLRERFELNDTPLFGLGAQKPDSWLIQRAQVHVDAHFGGHIQTFVQFVDARAFGKNTVTPVDKNPLDIEQAFVAAVYNLGPGVFKARVGRQEMAFDLQRFISVRDGPNMRQAFDALWADYETSDWRVIGYLTQPVQNRDVSAFDDVSNRHLTFSGVRAERANVGPGHLSAYWSRYERDNARLLDASGTERRDVFDTRYEGKAAQFDWDAETMLQAGRIGASTISAWAFGALGGYTVASFPGAPRIGLQLDGASGDRHPHDGRVQTFNPLFPNGNYFTLAGYTGYSNLLHVKPSLTFKIAPKVTIMTALGFQWRETTGDAIYGQGMVAVPGTAGKGTLWTGMYAQVRADWTVNQNVAFALEAVHFNVGGAVRALRARNADYFGIESKFGW